MSEEAKSRTKEDISRDYSNLCTKAGHAAYQVATIQKDIELMQSTMRDLNLEAAAAAKAEEEAKSKEAPSDA
jgi:hypothetical protein